jgi:hypothetical protein
MRQTYTSESTGRRISRKRWLQQQLIAQRKWIESCESNGKSYTGPNGAEIRRADRLHLQSIEAQIG